jgi:hypothetical protein
VGIIRKDHLMEYRAGFKIVLKLVTVEIPLVFLVMFYIMQRPQQLVYVAPIFFMLSVLGGALFIYREAKLRRKK